MNNLNEGNQEVKRAWNWYRVTIEGIEGVDIDGIVHLSQFGVKTYEDAGYTVTLTTTPWEDD